MDIAVIFPAAYRIGGLEYTYKDYPKEFDDNGSGVTGDSSDDGSEGTEDSIYDGFGFTERHDSPIFWVLVGPSKTAYFVHQTVLCKSPVFERFCTSGLRESQTRCIELPEDDPTVVGHLIDFLYLGYYLTCPLTGDGLVNLLAKIYIAADKYMVHGLKELVVQHLEDDRCLPSLTDDRFLEVPEHIYWNISDSDDCFSELFTHMACDRFEDVNFFYHARQYLSSTAAFVEDLFEAQHRARMFS